MKESTKKSTHIDNNGFNPSNGSNFNQTGHFIDKSIDSTHFTKNKYIIPLGPMSITC